MDCISKDEYIMPYRQHYEYFYNLMKEHKIGEQILLGSFYDKNGEEYNIFILAYYEYIEPHIVLLNNNISSVMYIRLSNYTLMKYIGENKFDDIKTYLNDWLSQSHTVGYHPKYWLMQKKWENKWIESNWRVTLIYEWNKLNPYYRIYHKLWRKFKNGWYGKRKLNYKKIRKLITYYEWQERDPWFLTNKDIERMKKNGWWSERFEYPNLVEHYYDGKPKLGYWSNHIEENIYE